MILSLLNEPAQGNTNQLCLYLDDIGVSTASTGSIMIEVMDSHPALPSVYTKTYPNVLGVDDALMVKAMAMNPTALVSENFMMLRSAGMTAAGMMAPVGSIEFGVNMTGTESDMPLRSAVDGSGIAGLDDILNLDSEDGSMVTFTGDFSFTSKVTLRTTTACSGGSDIRMAAKDDGTRDLSMTMSQMLNETQQYLCIHVDGETVIPETSPYMAEARYVADADKSPFKPSTGAYGLGYIMRDGATVELPYLTQYNQRIVVRNRGSAARYNFTFDAEDAVTVTRKSEASGTLPTKSITYFSLMHGDLVTIEGSPNRAAATLTVWSQPRLIDVLISQTNADGGTDTVSYTKTHNQE